ncbi:Putative transport protein [Pantoea sp. Nvir]|uniref:AI-2E family transporter n=1 Tax=Pantoea TaxID=53335 RepID=UPI000CDD5B1C|nr:MULTISPECIES: AI-2E family transporter [Pantoea]MCG7365028.1 AI-2E family transporter [Pantoea sp. ACRSH]MCG7395096.1 AI-2E family transporter [Pantoea sp. ACRSC]POW58329.1 AI-2E family transporter [Pantoea alvi]UBN53485.1 AI-2E family transporter [Pantoea agglomerans]
MRVKGLNIGFFIVILAIVTVAFFDVLAPYFSPILWAAILAVIFAPLKTWLRHKMGDRNGVASLVTLLIICLIVFTPLAIIASSLVVEINTLYLKLQTNSAQFPAVFADLLHHLPRWLRSFLSEHEMNNATQIQQKLSTFALKGGQYMAGSVFLIGKGTFTFTVGFGVMLYLLFFLLKDGSYLVHLILEALPLSTYVKHHLFMKFAAVSRATVKGTVVVGIVQGILGGLAFWFVDIDGSLLWGALMAFLSLIPAVGSAIIWVPAAIFFFATGALWKGLFLVGFFVVIVGLVDNILRPLLVGKDTKMPDYLILIATLGGMEIYGINGFVIGPLIAALFIACWNLLSGKDNRDNVEEIDEEFIEEGKKHSDEAAIVNDRG